MNWVYRLTIICYNVLLVLASPFNSKAREFLNGRKGWREKLKTSLKDRSEKLIWIHAASQGEYQQGLPVIRNLKKLDKNLFVLLTFFSPSGYQAFKESEHVDAVAYLPLDYPRNAIDFLDLVNPQLALFIKYEFWYHYMIELHKRSIPLILVSSVFRSDQMFFHSMGRFYLRALQKTTHFFVQDDQSAKLLKSHGMNQFTVSGDSRLDQMLSIREDDWSDEKTRLFVGSSLVMVCGSVWPSDWQYLKMLIAQFKEVKFIVAPHEITNEGLSLYQIESSALWSSYGGEDASVLIVDEVGSLKYLYRYADITYVGGALRGAVHNTIEPAVYGKPIIIAGHTKNVKFNEVMDLKDAGGLLAFEDENQLFDIFEQLIHDQHKRERLGKLNSEYVKARSGATDKIMTKLRGYL